MNGQAFLIWNTPPDAKPPAGPTACSPAPQLEIAGYHVYRFGRPLAKLGGNVDIIANARMDIEQARLLTLKTAWMMDNVDPKEARVWISMIKTAVPNMSIRVVDQAIQMFGALGVSQDTPLANMYMAQRTLRLADGPDEVHRMVVGRNELRKYIKRDDQVNATFRDG